MSLFNKGKKEHENLEKINLSYQQMFYTNALSIEAIVNVLESKGILTKEEVLAEIKKLGAERKKHMEDLDESIKKS